MQVRDKYQEFAFRINLTINLTLSLSLSLSQHLQIYLRRSFCNFVGSLWAYNYRDPSHPPPYPFVVYQERYFTF